MNYFGHYERLISRAIGRKINHYTEKHHILPRCLGGPDTPENIVLLTAEEHYVAHQLLVKIYPNNYKLVNAAVMMSMNVRGNRPKNKLYGWLRRKLAEANSFQQTGKNNSQSGTCWVYHIENKKSKKIKIADLGLFLDNGWHRGRVNNFENRILRCVVCDKVFPDRNRNTNQKTCSKSCFSSLAKTTQKCKDPMQGREDEFIEFYSKYKSINKALKQMGFPGNQSVYGKKARKILAGMVQ